MALGLPDEVLQGLGIAPPGMAPPAPSLSPPPLDAGLHPSVQQALGFGQPPSPSPDPPPPPMSLPSAPPPDPQHDQQARPDFQIPISEFRQPEPAAKPPAAPRPPTPDQRIGQADAAQRGADEASQVANDANTSVKVAEAQAQQEHYARANAEHDRLQSELKAEQDDFKKTHAEKQAILDGFNKEVDSYKVDQNKYWNEMGVGQHVGAYVGMALAGLGNAFLGMGNAQMGAAENPVIKMLQDKARQSIQLQMDQREQLEKRAGRAEHALDKYDAFSKDRQAQILAREADADRNLARMVQTTAAKFAAPEAQANGMKIAADLSQQSAGKQAEAAQRAAAYDQQKKQTAIAQQNLGISGGHLALARDQFAWTKNKDQQQLDLEAAKIAAKGDPKAGEAYQKFGVAGVANKDGTPFIAQGTPEGVEKVREKKAASMTIVGILDQAMRLRTGYSNSATDRAEWQRLQQLWGAAKAKGKDALGLGALSGDDYKLLDAYLGAADPTQFRDPSAGIRQARETVMRDLNDTLKSHGLDGEFKIEDLSTMPPAAPPTPVERITTLLKSEPDQNPSRARDQAFNATFKSIYNPAKGNAEEARAAGLKASVEAGEAARAGLISPDQRQGLADLKAIALAGGPEARSALASLTEISGAKQGSKLIRELADDALREIKKATSPGPLTDPGQNYDPNGYNPQALINRFTTPIPPPSKPAPVASK